MNLRSVGWKGRTLPVHFPAGRVHFPAGRFTTRWHQAPQNVKYTLCVPARPGPTWYKATLLNWLAAFPVITLVQLAFKPLLRLLPFLLQMLLSTGVVALVLTLLVMPGMNRLFARWLQTPPAGRAPNL